MQAFTIHMTPDAVTDLENIYLYISDKSGYPERAFAYTQKLHAKCRDLENTPFCGQMRDDLLKGLRIAPIDKKAVVAFLVDKKKREITILNIFYGGRDYDTLMSIT